MHPEILSQAKILFTTGLNISGEKDLLFLGIYVSGHLMILAKVEWYIPHISVQDGESFREGANTEPKEKQCRGCEPKFLQAQNGYNLCHVVGTHKSKPAESLALYLLMKPRARRLIGQSCMAAVPAVSDPVPCPSVAPAKTGRNVLGASWSFALPVSLSFSFLISCDHE